jgi:hypothetical protein
LKWPVKNLLLIVNSNLNVFVLIRIRRDKNWNEIFPYLLQCIWHCHNMLIDRNNFLFIFFRFYSRMRDKKIDEKSD